MVVMLPLPGRGAGSRLKTAHSLLVNKAYLLVLSFILCFSLRGRLQVYRTSRDSSGALGGQRSSVRAPLASLQLISIPQKEAHTFLWSPKVCNFTMRTPQISLSGGQQGLHCSPTGLYFFKKIFDMCTQLYFFIYSLQYPCLENPMDRAAWRATVYSVAKCWT